jgi:hypothetical protein
MSIKMPERERECEERERERERVFLWINEHYEEAEKALAHRDY